VTFPPIEEVATKFGFSISEDIIAESGDWRLDINRDALQVMVERNSKLMQERVNSSGAFSLGESAQSPDPYVRAPRL
jgi:hypothetical protein